MSIKFAILGILSWKPSTGYELKKVFEDSSFMYWSGNNNQVYKGLMSLEKESLVTSELIHQDGSPSKKIYTITKEGQNELKNWLLSSPEAPEIKKIFLVQFAWSDQLTNYKLNQMLLQYEKEVQLQIMIEKEKYRRAQHSPGRSARENIIWELISENIISSYNNELKWLRDVRQRLLGNDVKEKQQNEL